MSSNPEQWLKWLDEEVIVNNTHSSASQNNDYSTDDSKSNNNNNVVNVSLDTTLDVNYSENEIEVLDGEYLVTTSGEVVPFNKDGLEQSTVQLESVNDSLNGDSNYVVYNEEKTTSQSETTPSISQTSALPHELTTPVRKRNRFAKPEEWHRNKAKNLRMHGESYVNSKGIQKAKREPNTTDCNCKFKCREKISIEQQHVIFDEYYQYGDVNRQKDFLCSLVQECPVVRKRKRNEDSDVERQLSRQYFLPTLEGEKVRVCLKFFCYTFSFSKKTIERTLSLKSPNGTYRGKNRITGRLAHNATPSETIRSINHFLSDLPKVPSHYCRQRSNRLYLQPDLTVHKLFELYCEQNGDNFVVKEHTFRRVFKEYEPPLALFRPKKDQCTVCNTAESTKTTGTDEKYIAHRKRNAAIQAMKKKDKEYAKVNREKSIFVTFDLQAILTLPYAGDGQIYYSRKLSVMNFTIHDSRERGICYLWDETNGLKGSAEIGTFLINYIECLPRTIESVVLYADTCGGQNRNKNVFGALYYAVNTHKNKLNTIDLKFMESGHSYLEADSIHSTIEREKKNKKIYTPEEYKLIIQMSRKKPFPYTVNTIKYDQIYNLEALNEITPNVKNTITGAKLRWLDCKWFHFERGNCRVGFKYDVECNSFDYIEVCDRTINWDTITLEKKYQSPLPITKEKKRDLLKLLKKGVIPTSYASFYNNLPTLGKNEKNADAPRDVPLWNNDEQYL